MKIQTNIHGDDTKRVRAFLLEHGKSVANGLYQILNEAMTRDGLRGLKAISHGGFRRGKKKTTRKTRKAVTSDE